MSILELTDVKKDFSKLIVLRGIDMSVEEGARHAIIGPNGAGKTTLFNVITGKHQASSRNNHFQGDQHCGLFRPCPQSTWFGSIFSD